MKEPEQSFNNILLTLSVCKYAIISFSVILIFNANDVEHLA